MIGSTDIILAIFASVITIVISFVGWRMSKNGRTNGPSGNQPTHFWEKRFDGIAEDMKEDHEQQNRHHGTQENLLREAVSALGRIATILDERLPRRGG